MASGNTFGARQWTDGKMEAPMLPDLPRVTRCHACGGFFWVERARQLGAFEPWSEDAGETQDVFLEEVGARRVELMACLRRIFARSLGETKALLGRVPVCLAQGLLVGDAHWLVGELREAGAVATTRVRLGDSEALSPEQAREWKEAPFVKPLSEEQLLMALQGRLAQSREDWLFLRCRAWWASNDPFRRPGVTWRPWPSRSPEARENVRALAELYSPEDATERLMKAESFREREHFEEALALLRGDFPEDLTWAADFMRELARQRCSELRPLPQRES